jgi:hypothetical protein
MEENTKAKQDKLLADWAKIDADQEKRRADLKAFNEMTERREAERKGGASGKPTEKKKGRLPEKDGRAEI